MKYSHIFKKISFISLASSLFMGCLINNINEIKPALADSNPVLNLGEFDSVTKTFKNATATNSSNTFKYVDVFLCDELSDTDDIVIPTISGYSVNKENLYDISIELDSAKSAKSIMEDCISKIQFNVSETQAIRVTLQDSANESNKDYFYFAENDHYYSFVSFPSREEGGTEDWFTSYNLAKEMTYMGRTGYLATITSLEEDLFIYKASGRKVGWLGGTTLKPTTPGAEGSLYNTYSAYEQANYDDVHFKYWVWACGPEKDEEFFDLDNADGACSDAVYERNIVKNYMNWDAAYGEPNNPREEDCLTTLCIGEGYSTNTYLDEDYSWNNLRCTAKKQQGEYRDDYVSNGFVVEFGDKKIGNSESSSSGTPASTNSVTTIGYTDNSHVVEDNVTSINMKTKPTKLNYVIGEDLDVTGGVVNVNYESGKTEEVTLTIDMISGYDKETVGKQTLTVTYLEKTTTFDVKVAKASSDEGSSTNAGIVVLIVILCLLLLLLILLAVLYILWKLKDFKLIKFLIKYFRKINKLLFKTPLNNVEKKDAEKKEMSDEEYLEYLENK